MRNTNEFPSTYTVSDFSDLDALDIYSSKKLSWTAIPGLSDRIVNRRDYARISYYASRQRGFKLHDLLRKTRKREVVMTRQIIFYLCRKYTKLSSSSIGRLLLKDHATVLHSVKNIKDLMETDKSIKNEVETYERYIEREFSLKPIKRQY